MINPFKQKNINSQFFFEFLKILFSYNDININNDKIKEISSNINKSCFSYLLSVKGVINESINSLLSYS